MIFHCVGAFCFSHAAYLLKASHVVYERSPRLQSGCGREKRLKEV
jgi:hypothetical protein